MHTVAIRLDIQPSRGQSLMVLDEEFEIAQDKSTNEEVLFQQNPQQEVARGSGLRSAVVDLLRKKFPQRDPPPSGTTRLQLSLEVRDQPETLALDHPNIELDVRCQRDPPQCIIETEQPTANGHGRSLEEAVLDYLEDLILGTSQSITDL